MATTSSHYENLAATYDHLWSHSQSFISGMTDLIVRHLDPKPEDKVVDLGGGTGIYAKALLERVNLRSPIIVVDPSPSMLKDLHGVTMIEPIVGDADSFSQQGELVDGILIKEAVHHFSDPASSLAKLGACLSAKGRILIVMLPPRIKYPLFRAALEKYEELQPHYLDIARALCDAELEVEIAHHTLNVELPTSRYIDMVENRYMSLLSEFNDEEIASGIEEMRRNLETDTVVIPDKFVFLTGVRTGD